MISEADVGRALQQQVRETANGWSWEGGSERMSEPPASRERAGERASPHCLFSHQSIRGGRFSSCGDKGLSGKGGGNSGRLRSQYGENVAGMQWGVPTAFLLVLVSGKSDVTRTGPPLPGLL
ncbi:hypothetical protein R1flu_011616 [Riccia fluitans]|uniref:Uncharacterized protein n=1 Tax=Riccia fluitans TaxID=41844 RepID=A0ABD1ZAW2_9MARC